jgi:hypothetical protein
MMILKMFVFVFYNLRFVGVSSAKRRIECLPHFQRKHFPVFLPHFQRRILHCFGANQPPQIAVEIRVGHAGGQGNTRTGA